MTRAWTTGAAIAALVAGLSVVPSAARAEAPEPLWVPDPELPDSVRQDPPTPSAAFVRSVATVLDVDPSKVAVAHWMARSAQSAGLPGELPIMAALVESGLRNLPYGHADSVGYFQMRTSIWDSGVYAGYYSRPQLQMQWFIDRALRVRDVRRGADPDFGSAPADFGEWVADVERPRGDLRGLYQLRLSEASALLAQGAPDTTALDTGAGFGGATTAVVPPDPASVELADRVLKDPNITVDPRGRIDLESGRVDARVMSLMLEAAARTRITVSVIQTGHAFHTVNGTPSNHAFGRAIDVSTVGGAPVDASNAKARELALELAALPSALRPTEIGTPWAIDAPAFFTDAGHQDHLHLGYDDPGSVIPRSEVRAATERREDARRRVRRAPAPRSEPRFSAAGEDDGATRRDPDEPRFEVGA